MLCFEDLYLLNLKEVEEVILALNKLWLVNESHPSSGHL